MNRRQVVLSGFTVLAAACEGYCASVPLTASDRLAQWSLGEWICSAPTRLKVQFEFPNARWAWDRPDEVSGSQVHIVYAIPDESTFDRAYDLSGTLRNSVGSWQTWLSGETGGRKFRLDNYQGNPDVTFFRLPRRDATMLSFGSQIRDTIEVELARAGRIAPNKIYAVYYDGSGPDDRCGGAAWPPNPLGVVAALYIRGRAQQDVPCDDHQWASSPTALPAYREYAMIHEVMHTLGIVDIDAPFHHDSGHVHTHPNDLMYAPESTQDPGWTFPAYLDIDRDDYFNPNGLPLGIFNLATSPFLLP